MARNIDQLDPASALAAADKYVVAQGDTSLKRSTLSALAAFVLSSVVSKDPVAVATTGNITLSGEQTINGVLTASSRVLVKNQTLPAENGVYVSAAGAWSRATDMDSWAEVPGAIITVTGGTVNPDSIWLCTANEAGTLGTTAITFVQFAGANLWQPYSARLSQFTGAWTADRLFYTTGSASIAQTALTAFMRTLLDDATAAAAKATLGVHVVDSVIGTYSTNADLNTVIPTDDSIPQVTEGVEIISVAITPKSTTNKLRVTFTGMGALSTNIAFTAALFLNGAADAIAATCVRVIGADTFTPITFQHEFVPGSVVSQTLSLRVGPAAAATLRMNGATSGRRLGGTAACVLRIEEIYA